ncbi:transmembrane anti-sigma factor [Intrasporangium oryzae NRRL B-24470]|uniref:Transmembrane anti-sigma factor n=1 Tax=Intrasporangium oryzae NRRL B-24470 TaxID=1386089 RepID=W9G8S5_9MICO|nr:zf-HC2 domain-containing protein [Intrasporangium oryzae]EWT02576.1 transmembrane anti-sigma factor [Intrasporangium oryzae NRRL B-24470]
MSCRFAHDDGAYVLGALSPTERADFEQHLDDCPRCARSVQELAGLPGLLARVDAEMLEPPPVEPVPETLLPALVRVARRTQRRRSFVTAAAAAAAAVMVAVGAHAVGAFGGAPTAVAGASPTTTVTLPVGQAMVPLEAGSVRANLALHDVAWGTRLDLTCTYASAPGSDYDPGQPAAYSLVIRTKDGRTEQVATWRSVPGHTMRLSAATAASRADIASAEVRTADGEPILRLTT